MPFPIYVLNKGRAGRSPTCRQLDEACLPYTLFVCPSEAEDYQQHYQGTIAYQPESASIATIRNVLLDHARMQYPDQWVWFIDDDIVSLVSYDIQKKTTKRTWEVLREIEQHIESFDGAQAALDYRHVCYFSKVPYRLNSYCFQVMAIHTTRSAPVRYRNHLRIFEDTDFTLQLLLNGQRTLRFETYGYESSPGGTRRGGLYEEYRTTSRHEAAIWLGQHYGSALVECVTDTTGNVVPKVKWHFFSEKAAEQRPMF